MFRNKMDDLKQSGLSNLSNDYHFDTPQRRRPVIPLKQPQFKLIDWHNKIQFRHQISCPNKFNMVKEHVSRKKYFASNFHQKSQIKENDIIKLGIQIPQYHDSLSTLDIEGAVTNTIIPLALKNIYSAHKVQKQLGLTNLNTKNLKQQRTKTLGDYENEKNHLPVLSKQSQLKDHSNYRRFNVLTPNGQDHVLALNKKIEKKQQKNFKSHRNLSLNQHIIQQKIKLTDSKIRVQDINQQKQQATTRQAQIFKIFPVQNKKARTGDVQYPYKQQIEQSLIKNKKDAIDYYLQQKDPNQEENPQFKYVNLYGKVSPTYLSSINGLSSNNGAFLGYKEKSKINGLKSSKLRFEQNKQSLQQEMSNQRSNFRKYLKSNKL